MSATICGITVTKPKTPRLARLVATHGTTYRYEHHVDHPEVAVRVACTCPDGHGVAGLPWRGWISTSEARMTLADIQPPAPPKLITLADIAQLPTPDDLVAEPPHHTQARPAVTMPPLPANLPAAA